MQLKALMKNNLANNSGDGKVVLPYLFEFYNVMAYFQKESSGVRSLLARVLNALVAGLNEKPRLPRYIVVVLDMNLLDQINIWEPEAAVIKACNILACWLAKKINILIKRKRLSISEKNPGAVFGEDPRVIYVKMLRRAEFYPLSCHLGKVCAARTKFNESLNMAAAKFGHYIMNVSTCTRRDDFNVCGNLSEVGKKLFWRELDHLMERFDRNEIHLRPVTRMSSKYSKKNRSFNDNY